MFMNQTSCVIPSSDEWLFYPPNFPLYYSPKEYVVDGIPDRILTVTSPIIAYWVLSMFFHCLDVSGWKWLEKYRIHESEEARKKNVVSRSRVIGAVIFQQVIQTVLGLAWVEETRILNHAERIRGIGALLRPILTQYLGEWGRAIIPRVIHLTYWWFIPAAQFAFAM